MMWLTQMRSSVKRTPILLPLLIVNAVRQLFKLNNKRVNALLVDNWPLKKWRAMERSSNPATWILWQGITSKDLDLCDPPGIQAGP